jgi:hypothetical protein
MRQKIYCKNLDEYILVQKISFKLGYSWVLHDTNILTTHHKYIFLSEELFITHSNNIERFYNSCYKESFYEEVTLIELKNRIKMQDIQDKKEQNKELIIKNNNNIQEDADNKRESFTKLLSYFGRTY